MSDDSFFREVEEEIRQDRARAIWQKYGYWIIAGAVAIVLGTLAFTLYQNWTESRANASGDAFLHALTLAGEGRVDEARAALETLEQEGYGSYPVLARLRIATLHEQTGEYDEAVAEFDAVAADSAMDAAVRDLARLRAGYILVDHGDRAAVAERVEVLAGDGNPLRHSAREALGLSAWKAGATEDAARLFQQIIDDPAAPRGIRERATIVADLIRSGG